MIQNFEFRYYYRVRVLECELGPRDYSKFASTKFESILFTVSNDLTLWEGCSATEWAAASRGAKSLEDLIVYKNVIFKT